MLLFVLDTYCAPHGRPLPKRLLLRRRPRGDAERVGLTAVYSLLAPVVLVGRLPRRRPAALAVRQALCLGALGARRCGAHVMHIVGVSCFYSDAAAALIQEGRVIAAAQEERFNPAKHDNRYPHHWIRVHLRDAEIRPGEIDHVANAEGNRRMAEELFESLTTDPAVRKMLERIRR